MTAAPAPTQPETGKRRRPTRGRAVRAQRRSVRLARAGIVCAILPALLALSPGAGAVSGDDLTARNVVPPGESGLTTLADFLAVTGGVSSSWGPHTQDQLGMYASWRYKPMQFEGEGMGTAPPGNANVTIWRDPTYGVPTITGKTDADTFYGLGYAMAQDRLWQMEVFRHVGQGTLAELIGASGLAMDREVRRFSAGDAALQAELDALPEAAKARLSAFVDGINAQITEVNSLQARMPAEFALLADLPIQRWTVLDVLGFSEYAGRFFGEFGHGELAAAVTYLELTRRYGRRKGERIFEDLLPLNDPHAPTSISRSEGRFPRHHGAPVRTRYRPSPYANHDPAKLPPLGDLDSAMQATGRATARVARLQRKLPLPQFGSNAVIVSGSRTRSGEPMLYGGPQTGWAAPGFFWEAELHSPARDQRGVMVPAIPLMVIGRNRSAAWTATSALDANSDLFVVRLNASNTAYKHDGRWLPVRKRVESIPCRNPPTVALDLLAAATPRLCPATGVEMTTYRTALGPAVAGPDAGHRLYVRRSSVDGRLLRSLSAWDRAGRQTSAHRFGAALRKMALGFNFFYADNHGSIGYWHAGAYPIRPANADPTLPMPGGGRYDWRGYEPWRAHPAVINPRRGWLVNWNNKPAVGWWSKNLETGSVGSIWGDEWESVPLARVIARSRNLSLHGLGQVPRKVAYIDNRARVLKPYLVRALRGTKNAQLAAMRDYLRRWNGRRDVLNGNGGYGTPAVAFFDRFVENLLRGLLRPVLGSTWFEHAGLDCPSCHMRSVDNLSTPTYKFEYAGEQLLIDALRGRTRYDWVRHRRRLLRRTARQTASQLTASQGPDPSRWTEPVESAAFAEQGAISVAPVVPLPNRGSYGQVVQARRR